MTKFGTVQIVGIAAAVVLAGCGKGPVGAVSRPGSSVAAQSALAPVRAGEIVVKFRNALARQTVATKLGLRSIGQVSRINAQVYKAADAKKAIAALKADPGVLYAEPNYVAKAYGMPSVAPRMGFTAGRGADELQSKLWGMAKIGAEKAWATATGKGVKLAVVDTGIDYNHPEFGGRVVDKGRDFAGNNPDAFDDHYHGTHCAGTVGAGLGNGGLVGVAPDVSLVAVKVLGADGTGSYAGVANGIIYAADSGASIISMSLGGSSTAQVLDDAVAYAIGKGALVVAAMGNEGSMNPSYPAACKGVMPVGATGSEDTLPNFTNSGKHISVTAPGVDILSTTPGNAYDELSGTSMSTPHVAGLAALVKAANPTFTAGQIRSRIESTVDDKGLPGYDIYFGHGRINAAKALAAN